MDPTFITIQDLSADSHILYASNSISDILGYTPKEVINRSSWDFFHPEEVPFAQEVYGRGISLDKAAVLNYAHLKHKSGRWVGCECVFSIVNDVLVGCVSQYHNTSKSQKRALDAPVVRQLFSSSPKDPRYHMLSYISNKFTQPSDPQSREPRAALFLNRFTRTLPIMFASNGLQNVLGISSDQLHNKSFYYCIQENCLAEAIRCLESAKANDSIAYLRFWYRDPREEESEQQVHQRRRVLSDASDMTDDDDGGVPLNGHMDIDSSDSVARGRRSNHISHNSVTRQHADSASSESASNLQHHSSGSSTAGRRPSDVFDINPRTASTAATTPFNEEPGGKAIELEAVVSCTSDGLVVILRQARPFALDTIRQRPVHYRNGIFASPWASEPVLPTPARPEAPFTGPAKYTSDGRPIYEPMYSEPEPAAATQGPRVDDFMQSIREVAVFAWALTGINGCLSEYTRGAPMPGSVPAQMPVWEQHADNLGRGYGVERDVIMG